MRERGADLIELVRNGVIGADAAIEGPFGPRRVVYCDYTASGRALGFLEDFLRDEVLPLHANTHSETSGTGRQTTRLREDARAVIAGAVGAGPEDVVLFCGSGATGAIDKLIGVLQLRLPADLDRRHGLRARVPPEERPVVFLGPYEHHSNELPWRESLAEVVPIDEDAEGRVDLAHLERQLRRHADRKHKIGSFSAASNVTGILTDTDAVSTLLHRHGALAFWDYAAAGPYVEIAMNPPGAGAHKDAVFLSPHKFVGGPGTPGVLVAKRALFTNSVPAVPGGGTVAYVNAHEHRYVAELERREEGGTPDIPGSIRAGLVFQLQQAVGAAEIGRREEDMLRRALASWSANPNLHLLGNLRAPRLGIVSFVVRHGARRLHHEFVLALLNDLFGIQARGGCSCAGPYGHRLLGIDLPRSKDFERAVLAGWDGIKPGWVRVGFHWSFSPSDVDFVVEAVHLVASEGWKLLPDYAFDPRSGLWRHRAAPPDRDLRLAELSYDGGRLAWPSRRRRLPESALADALARARELFAAASARPPAAQPNAAPLPPSVEALRWFPLPSEAAAELTSS